MQDLSCFSFSELTLPEMVSVFLSSRNASVNLLPAGYTTNSNDSSSGRMIPYLPWVPRSHPARTVYDSVPYRTCPSARRPPRPAPWRPPSCRTRRRTCRRRWNQRRASRKTAPTAGGAATPPRTSTTWRPARRCRRSAVCRTTCIDKNRK